VPTFQRSPTFKRDWRRLTADEQQRFRKVITEQFVPDLVAGDIRAGLRVKGVKAARGVYEMTWSWSDPDGRATFEYGAQVHEGEPHIIWRRIGTHIVFREP
jgi:hypothetical protein